WALRGNRVGVVGSQRFYESLPHAVAALIARKDDDDVGADRLELPADQSARALADRNHCGHGRDADDDAEDGQPGAELVLRQGAESNAESEEEVHWHISE